MNRSLTRTRINGGIVHHAVRLADYLRLTRPSNALGAAALVLVGSRLVTVGTIQPTTWLATWAMWCIASYGYAGNDLADVAEDRVNKPHRPLPSGRIPPRRARQMAQGLASAGIMLAMPLGVVATTAAIVVVALLTVYNQGLKSTLGLGNLLIGLLAGCALLTGAVSQVGLFAALRSGILMPAAVLAAAITAREILKTVEDLPGDHVAGRATLATRLGATATLRIYAGVAAVAWLLMPLPVVWLDYAPAYLVCVIVGVGLPLLLPLIETWRRRTALTAQQVRPLLRYLKLSYLAGILALILA